MCEVWGGGVEDVPPKKTPARRTKLGFCAACGARRGVLSLILNTRCSPARNTDGGWARWRFVVSGVVRRVSDGHDVVKKKKGKSRESKKKKRGATPPPPPAAAARAHLEHYAYLFCCRARLSPQTARALEVWRRQQPRFFYETRTSPLPAPSSVIEGETPFFKFPRKKTKMKTPCLAVEYEKK